MHLHSKLSFDVFVCSSQPFLGPMWTYHLHLNPSQLIKIFWGISHHLKMRSVLYQLNLLANEDGVISCGLPANFFISQVMRNKLQSIVQLVGKGKTSSVVELVCKYDFCILCSLNGLYVAVELILVLDECCEYTGCAYLDLPVEKLRNISSW